MKIAGIQKLTLLDFPGHIAATIFTPGCDLRCPFCHNSELVLNKTPYEYYEDEVLDFLKGRTGKLDGIAITGGEPLMQPDIKDFILKLRALGFKIKLDTNGTFPEKLKELLDEGLLDNVAMDIKNSKESWGKTTGLLGKAAEEAFEKTLLSMRYIEESKVSFEYRTTVVRELHSVEDMKGLGELVRNCPNYYLQNFTDSGEILEKGYTAWDRETLYLMLEEVRKYNKNASLRGVD